MRLVYANVGRSGSEQALGRGIADLTVRPSLPNAFGFGGFGDQSIQIQVEGSDPTVLNNLVDQITSIAQSTSGAVDVNNELQNVSRSTPWWWTRHNPRTWE